MAQPNLAKKRTIEQRIDVEFDTVRAELGHVPTRMEFLTRMSEQIYGLCFEKTVLNPFRSYLYYLNRRGFLTASQRTLCNGIGGEFIELIETTKMVKVYKMPVLYSFYNHGCPRMAVTDRDVLDTWKEFFDISDNWKDFSTLKNEKTKAEYQALTDSWHIDKATDMPIRFLLKSGKGFFIKKNGYALALKPEMKTVIDDPEFAAQMKDAIDYRVATYYDRRITPIQG